MAVIDTAYRKFKRLVVKSNHENVVAFLLLIENRDLTVRCLLGGVYAGTNVDRLFQNIYRQCPRLFSKAAPLSERQARDEEEEEESAVQEDACHPQIYVRGFLHTRSLDKTAQPSRLISDGSQAVFQQQLRDALEVEHGIKNVWLKDGMPVQWYSQFTFFDKQVPSCCSA